MYSDNSIKKKIEELENSGFSLETIKNLYFEQNLSQNEIISLINTKNNSHLLHKHWIKRIFEVSGIEKKSFSEIEKLRIEKMKATYSKINSTEVDEIRGKGNKTFSKKGLIEDYDNGESLEAVYRRTGISPVTFRKVLEYSGRQVKHQIEYSTIVDLLEKNGVCSADIEKFYITEAHTCSELKEFIKEKTGYAVGNKIMIKVLRNFGIVRSVENAKAMQGAKSRFERATSYSNLKKAGFDSAQILANYYESNHSVTYESLVTELNNALGEDYFSSRWLQRHMFPLLSEDRLRGTSRLELNVKAFVESIYSGEILSSHRSLITPYEVDFYFPELNIALEVNGDYWHSDKFLSVNHGMSAAEYHDKKFKSCADKGVQLVFLWESDWSLKRDECEKSLELLFSTGIVDPLLLKSCSSSKKFK